MNILAFECLGKKALVALLSGNAFLELRIDTGRHHEETLMPAVDTLLRFSKLSPKDLDLVGCPSGPGPFTGLRIGMATAKGIARGAACALKTVPSLEFLATGREHWPGIVVPIIDARKKRVYAAAFKNGDQPILVTGPGACMAKTEENTSHG